MKNQPSIVTDNLSVFYSAAHKSLPNRYRIYAEDLAQDAVIKALINMEKYNPEKGTFSAWAFQLTRNLCIDSVRRLDRIQTVQLVHDNVAVKENYIEDIDKKLIRKAVSKLDLRDRQILIMREYFSCSGREIASFIEVPERQVPSLVHRARRRLAKIYNEAA